MDQAQLQLYLPLTEGVAALPALLDALGASADVRAWLARLDLTPRAAHAPGQGATPTIAWGDPRWPAALTLTPCALSWTPALQPGLTAATLELALRFDRQGHVVMKAPLCRAYDAAITPALWALTRAVSAACPRALVYLTDEASDGQSWAALFAPIARNRWWFDLASIPPERAVCYEAPPSSHHVTAREDGGLFIARDPSWVTLPWAAAAPDGP